METITFLATASADARLHPEAACLEAASTAAESGDMVLSADMDVSGGE
jgi:hypothetical protein